MYSLPEFWECVFLRSFYSLIHALDNYIHQYSDFGSPIHIWYSSQWNNESLDEALEIVYIYFYYFISSCGLTRPLLFRWYSNNLNELIVNRIPFQFNSVEWTIQHVSCFIKESLFLVWLSMVIKLDNELREPRLDRLKNVYKRRRKEKRKKKGK